MIPHDLKHYAAPDAFRMIEEETAGWIFAFFLFLCFVADRMGWF